MRSVFHTESVVSKALCKLVSKTEVWCIGIRLFFLLSFPLSAICPSSCNWFVSSDAMDILRIPFCFCRFLALVNFLARSTRMWNSLPADLMNGRVVILPVHWFRQSLKTFLFRQSDHGALWTFLFKLRRVEILVLTYLLSVLCYWWALQALSLSYLDGTDHSIWFMVEQTIGGSRNFEGWKATYQPCHHLSQMHTVNYICLLYGKRRLTENILMLNQTYYCSC